MVLGLAAGLAAALVLLSPPVLVIAVAGLALIPALGSALASAVSDSDDREAAVITFVVTAAGLSIRGIGSAFWGLLAGILSLVLRKRSRQSTEDDHPAEPAPPAIEAKSGASS